MQYYLHYDQTTGLIIGAPYCDAVYGKEVPTYNTEPIITKNSDGTETTQAAGTVQTGTTLDLSAIPAPYIEITEAEHDDWMQNQSTRKVDVTTKTLISYTPAVVVLTTAQQTAVLDATYQPQFTAVTQAYLSALTAGDGTTAAARQADYATLKTAYATALAAIS